MNSEATRDQSKVVVAVVHSDGKFLLIQRRATEGALSWSFPGGKVEAGESEMEAAVREVREETGVYCRARRKMGERVHPDTGRLISYVLCDYDAGKAHNAEPRSTRRVSWFPPKKVFSSVTTDIFEPVRLLLQRAVGRDADRGALPQP